jgi:hypothetical protein
LSRRLDVDLPCTFVAIAEARTLLRAADAQNLRAA